MSASERIKDGLNVWAQVVLGLLGFFFFEALAVLVFPFEWLYVLGAQIVDHLLGEEDDNEDDDICYWELSVILFRISNKCYDWSGLPD